ncbi:MAG: acetyl-CoA carboxylase biotin carboxyl carrier protein [Candidatus Latescibacteria bacterium]|nr:acetyl-CoA carboxylase biotin carboxyl carrier protein [Candidatus Latescibacterota bacterium]
MNEAKLKKLLALFADSDIEELEIEHRFWGGTRIRLSRRAAQAPVQQVVETVQKPAQTPAPQIGESAQEADKEPPQNEGLHAVASPMVGTFYSSSSPEDDPFVKVGDQVTAGQTVCIIEAMKIMNEIEADMAGEVVEVAVDNGSPVEFNQPLVLIRPR